MALHPHLPSLRADEEGSPWRLLPGVILVLALINAAMITLAFLIAELVAGRAY
jgi:hypothetical protein